MADQVTPKAIHLSISDGTSSSTATASVALLGATVYSYISTDLERLFVSSKSSIEGPAAVRGGIPICWPVFGPPPVGEAQFEKLKQHGFARTSTWAFDPSSSRETPTSQSAVFHLSSCPSTSSLFAPPFVLTYTVTLTPSSLSASLNVSSPQSSTIPLSFQALLHAYFRLPTSVLPPAVHITPLGGKSFVDKVQGGAKGVEGRAVVDVDGPGGEVDRVYFGVPDSLELSYEGVRGGLEVAKVGLSDVVVWNPGPTRGAAMGDMEEGGASRYVCLEPGQIESFVTLKAGESWTGGITITPRD